MLSYEICGLCININSCFEAATPLLRHYDSDERNNETMDLKVRGNNGSLAMVMVAAVVLIIMMMMMTVTALVVAMRYDCVNLMLQNRHIGTLNGTR